MPKSEARPAAKPADRAPSKRKNTRQGSLMPAFLLCADAALFLFVLCALYAPDLLPVAPVGSGVGGW